MICRASSSKKKSGSFPVRLNVYDLSPINGYAYWLGLGVYHSGVEVHGVEYAFGAHDSPTTGIFEVEPKECPGFTFRKSILIGKTDLSPKEVRTLMEKLSEEYKGNAYNLITKNCNHFCNDACLKLIGKPIPRWVNRLARIGFLCNCVLPASLSETRVGHLGSDSGFCKLERKKLSKQSNKIRLSSSRSSSSSSGSAGIRNRSSSSSNGSSSSRQRRKSKMNAESFFSSSFFFLFSSVILFNSHLVQAQPSTTGYNCTANQTSKPCSTYVYYRGKPPDLLNLANISDLFNLGRPTIAELSNISSVAAPLLPEQSLLIPITCSCNSNLNYSYANFTYKIKGGDTFYLVSTTKYQNLTTYQAVELVNPTLIPERLDIGVDVIFPVFCKCPDQNQLQQNQAKFLITYVFQPSDNFSSIANKFGADLRTLTAINKRNVSPYETVFVPVLQLPNFTQPVLSSTNNGSTTTGPSGQVSVRNDRKGVVTGLGIGLGITGFLLVSLILVMFLWVSRESKKKKGGIRTGSGLGKRKQGYEFAKPFSAKEEMGLMADVSDCLDKYKVYGIEEVREATADFDSSCLIHGSVYKGFMGGVYYAIKRMKWNAYEELKILQKVNHGSLVKLEGFCIDPEDGNCYLVYEYVENGSLHSWLHGDQMSRRKLDWKTRLRIAIDVANALQYIHEHTRPTVVHKDIKTSNILLDGNMRAKVANFGLARSGCNAITMHIVGTQGYISPEYLVDGVVTTKMDVFAFGVVLLELVSGKEAINEEGRVLWASAERVFSGTDNEKHQNLKEWMDEVLAEDNSCMDGVMSVMAVALACLQKDPSKRPNMVEVVYTLCKTNDLYSDFSEDGLSVTSVSAR